MRFGVSTQLYHGQRLCRAHLEEIAAHGFDAIEVVATRTHLDYHDADALKAFAGWLGDTGLRLHSIHAPVTESAEGGRWGAAYSNASGREDVRRQAVHETLAALHLAQLVPVHALVLHLGLPDSLAAGGDENSREAARRSVQEIVAAAAARNVTVALENIPSALAAPESIVSLIEHELEWPGLGACLDFGHANLMGGVVDAVEAFADVLTTTHLHDNHGARDEHLPPFEGTIAWPEAMMALRKIGYDGLLMVEVAPNGAPAAEVLARARRACARLEAELETAVFPVGDAADPMVRA